MSPNFLGGSLPSSKNAFHLTPLALVLSALLQASPSFVQASTLVVASSGNPYVDNLVGQPGTPGQGDDHNPQDGAPAPGGPGFTGVLKGTLTDNGSGPTLGVSVTGGAGGSGNSTVGGNGGPVGGTGGKGGTPETLTMTIDAGSQVQSSTTGSVAASLQSAGGNGGFGGGYNANNGVAGAAGSGGDAGEVDVYAYGSIFSQKAWAGTTPGATALLVSSTGGDGAKPDPAYSGSGQAIQSVGNATGRSGGDGGNGGKVSLTTQGAEFVSGGTGISLLSQGGQGSAGSDAIANGGTAHGGVGGVGGNGGEVIANIDGAPQNSTWKISAVGSPVSNQGNVINLPHGNSAETSFLSAAVSAQSFGGDGGEGGIAQGATAVAGAGGAAGSGGQVQVTLGDINVSTTGHTAPALLAQSIGGSGGDGASAGSVFKAKAGNGADGGNGSDVSVNVFSTTAGDNTQTTISTNGNDASGIVAQSIGGGGGAGGDVSTGSVIAGFAVGGSGESGGTAGTVNVYNGDYDDANGKVLPGAVILTSGDRSMGITALSVGGGGGSGGNASTTVGGVLAMTVGGTGGSGGSAGQRGTQQVSANNNGIVQTAGAHSIGMQAMAVGGGGGNGGSASSLETGAQLNVTLSVGGNGSKAGNAGDVLATNDGQILTEGADAYGMQVLSAGGGGGNGGASRAAAYQLLNTAEAPSLDYTLSIGGQGGAAGDGGNVTGTNNFSIVTSGDGSHGMLVQSIGGGGGSGGDSYSSQLSTKGSTLNFNMGIGGDGKGGGTAGTATATNNGLIWTMADDSDAILAQSIGGGGGNGGMGSADTSQFADNDSKKAGELELGVGGYGGSGDTADLVTVTNSEDSTLITMGDGSRGIVAQSIGGSGGNGGGSVANGSSGMLNARVAVGGNGGSGDNGGQVTVTNAGTIVTGGGDSAAIFAQSIGGGGGNGGKAATAGGDDPQTKLFNYLEKSLPSIVTTYSNNTMGFVPKASKLFSNGVNDVVNLIKGYYNTNSANGAPLPTSGSGGGSLDVTLNVGGGFAGKGGAGGDGDIVNVTNTSTGAIHTLGPMSAGIFALSTGGGGGAGGVVTAANNSSTSLSKLNATIAVGGQGGSSGNGGGVSVMNQGSVVTEGSSSFGLFGASIGGGGGFGGYTTTSVPGETNQLQTINVQLGGDAGTTGDGQGVGIYSIPAASTDPATLVSTSGSYAPGIGAFSIGGGGGVVSLNDTTTNAQTGGAVTTGGLQMTGFQFGGKTAVQLCGGLYSTCGNGAAATVWAQNVQTSGIDSPAIIAQSVGGSGGLLLAAGSGGASYFKQANGINGDGDSAAVHVTGGVSTTGAGAYGVVAQSVGGGGLYGGDIASSGNTGQAFEKQQPSIVNLGSSGNGGSVLVDVTANSSVKTSGNSAAGIFAQSVGGGGGLVASDNNLYMGTAGGKGTAGSVNVTVEGTVATTGINSPAIVVNADSADASTAPVTVGVSGAVTSNSDAIVVSSSSTSNTVTNNGVIQSADGHHAVIATQNSVDVNNEKGAQLVGAISLAGGKLTNNGTWTATGLNYAGSVDNEGSLVLGNGLNPVDFVANTVLNGNLTSPGTMVSSVDFVGGQASELLVSGTAGVSGTLKINPVTMAVQAVPIVSATKGLTVTDLTVQDESNYLYSYTPSIANNTLSVTPNANYTSAAASAGLSRNAQQLANHLQANFDSGVNALAPLYTALDQVKDPAQYRAALTGLSAESLQMVGVARLTSSESFVNRMNSCPDTDDFDASKHEHDCGWTRVTTQNTHADGSDGDTYRLQEHVLQFGAQHELADGWWLGGSLALSNGDESSASGVGGVTDHGFAVGAVIKREMGPWTVSGSVDVGQSKYQSKRNLQVGDQHLQAKGSFDATNFGLHSRVSYLVDGHDWYVKPYVDVHAVNIHTDGFQESDAGVMGLKVSAGNDTVLSASPMLEVGEKIKFDNGAELRPSVAVGRSYNTGDNWNTDMRLIGSGSGVESFNSELSTPRQMNQYTAGLNLKVNATSEVKLDYTGQSAGGYRMNEGAIRYTHFF